ncbi:hypothetical protein [Leifsonia sp. P73]|uniref:hypothetical protein n=1 Tax=Leifsonia sp. P73 TaxID=3423959 RepID=UPI003DA1EA18
MDRTQVRHRAHRIIVSRISDPTFGVEQLADELHFGRRQLHRYFNPGPSPHQMIM